MTRKNPGKITSILIRQTLSQTQAHYDIIQVITKYNFWTHYVDDPRKRIRSLITYRAGKS